MKIRVEKTEIKDAVFIHTEIFKDERGFFTEVFREDIWAAAGMPSRFSQVNRSGSKKGVIRGLHFQWDPPMGKLMSVISGQAFVVAVDIRKGSPTLGKWIGREMSADKRVMFWAPAGFARGFAVTSDFAEIQYLTTATYKENAESVILWSDPALQIPWPVENPILSSRDRTAQTLESWLSKPESDHFLYVER